MLLAVVPEKVQNLQAVFHYFFKVLIPYNSMKKTMSKSEARKQIEEFFTNIKGRSAKEVKKMKV